MALGLVDVCGEGATALAAWPARAALRTRRESRTDILSRRNTTPLAFCQRRAQQFNSACES